MFPVWSVTYLPGLYPHSPNFGWCRRPRNDDGRCAAALLKRAQHNLTLGWTSGKGAPGLFRW